MNSKYIKTISQNLNISDTQVKNTLKLLDEGATIPFISRYRKEATGSLDEVVIAAIKDQITKLLEIDKRRESIIKSLKEQEKLTDNLLEQLNNATSLIELEDIYLPYKPKKKTRASVAKAKGLEPLAKIIFEQKITDIENKAGSFLNDEILTIEDAISGAKDIVAEWISENQHARNKIRNLFRGEGKIFSKIIKTKKEEGIKYEDYFDFSELINKCPSHRILAVLRGLNDGFLRVSVSPPVEDAIYILEKLFVKTLNTSIYLKEAITDSYKRLLSPSIETEIINYYKETADEDAINVFAINLRQLLLAAPLGEVRTLAIDPGFRTGCKVVCLDEQGNLLTNATIYPNPPQKEAKQASGKILSLINAYKIDAISIGNGTAGRETETFIKRIRFEKDIKVFVINENGASIYSASKVAREEFPDYDVTVRGAVSIGRRLMDPLAELVKIDPKSIGVGQYQHDVNQKMLQQSLDHVVESCVNLVGVNLNTASKYLLIYVSGLSSQLAQNIIDFRKEKGKFENRADLMKVPRMGDKAYQQAAGFLRISNSKNPLDNSAVHPERYKLVAKMAKDANCSVEELINDENLRNKINIKNYINDEIGLPTLNDIINELAKPGRDPRKKAKVFEFAANIKTIEDLKTGEILPGIVTNITNFGAFVDIGIKQDGLVHISNIKNEFIKNPAEVVSLHQHVKVKIIDVDIERKRIQLSMKDLE